MFRLKTGQIFVILFCSFATISHSYAGFATRSSHADPELLSPNTKYHDVGSVYFSVSNQGIVGATGNYMGNYCAGSGLWFGANYDADNDGDLDKVFTQGFNPLSGDSEFREGRGDQDPNDPLTRVFDSRDSGDLAEWPPQFSDPSSGDPVVYGTQDLVTTYTTKDKSPISGEFQLPLEVNQRSVVVNDFSFSEPVIFIIFEVTNYGDDVLEDAWAGFFADTDIGEMFFDDLTSVMIDRVTLQESTVKLDVGLSWDSDFDERDFFNDPGFVGVSLLLSPGDPNDGVDNDDDGLVDESPFNGIDDDADGHIDGWNRSG